MADAVDSPTTVATEPPAGVSPAETVPATEPAPAGAPDSPVAPAADAPAETPSGDDPPPVAAVPPGYVPGAKYNKTRKELRQIAQERDQMAARLQALEAQSKTNEEIAREANTMRELRAVLAENPELEAMVLAQLQSDPKPPARTNGAKAPVARLAPEIEDSLKTVASTLKQNEARRDREERVQDQQRRIERIEGQAKAWCKAHNLDATQKIPNPVDPDYTRMDQVLDHLFASAHRFNEGKLDEEDIPEYLAHLDAILTHERQTARVGYARGKEAAAKAAPAAPPPSGAPITKEPDKAPSIRDTGKFNEYIKKVFGSGASAA